MLFIHPVVFPRAERLPDPDYDWWLDILASDDDDTTPRGNWGPLWHRLLPNIRGPLSDVSWEMTGNIGAHRKLSGTHDKYQMIGKICVSPSTDESTQLSFSQPFDGFSRMFNENPNSACSGNLVISRPDLASHLSHPRRIDPRTIVILITIIMRPANKVCVCIIDFTKRCRHSVHTQPPHPAQCE